MTACWHYTHWSGILVHSNFSELAVMCQQDVSLYASLLLVIPVRTYTHTHLEVREDALMLKNVALT